MERPPGPEVRARASRCQRGLGQDGIDFRTVEITLGQERLGEGIQGGRLAGQQLGRGRLRRFNGPPHRGAHFWHQKQVAGICRFTKPQRAVMAEAVGTLQLKCEAGRLAEV